MGEFLDAPFDIIQCAMACGLVELLRIGIPASSEFLHTGHVDASVVTEFLQIGHGCTQEAAILADGIAAEQ